MNFTQKLKVCSERVNAVLQNFMSPKFFYNTTLIEAMRYGVLFGGKRLRPFLVYATGNMFGVNDTTLDIPAAAIECIHAYSLIHDDLPSMDNNDLRRNNLTCHIHFNEGIALLAGDALQALAFSILSDGPMATVTEYDRIKMISELARASGATGLCKGQALDLEKSSTSQINLKQIEYIYRCKTGVLIRAAVRLGALTAGIRLEEYTINLLDSYSDNIGLAFQIQDDILDMIGNNVTLGKRQGADRHLGKNTYPTIVGIKQAKRKAENLINDAHQSLSMLSELSLDTSTLKELATYIIQRNK